jgi:dolichyl-phosphate-mannose-protein mannosyltransferase
MISVRRISNRLALIFEADPDRSQRVKVATVTAIFLLAVGVRLLHWQDSYTKIAQQGPWSSGIAGHYKSEAQRMLAEGGFLYPNRLVDPGDARLIIHPPGYSILIAAIFAVWGESDRPLRLAQIVLDALSAVMIFLIAAALFKFALATIAAVLVALSPHLAYHSIWISPDNLPVLPILVAVYLLIKASERPRLVTVLAAGAMIGLSCWLRANGLMLAAFMAVAVALLSDKSRRVWYAAALVGATVLVVSPITIRNWVLFHHFIPISIAGGENLIVGIADFDKEGRFGMPTSDGDAAVKDAVWYDRPDYRISAWLPDGVERDQARYARGLRVIRSNPRWFLGVMLQRAFFMLRYNDAGRSDWPFNTSQVPIVSAEIPAMHSPASAREMQPVWSISGPGLRSNASDQSIQAEISLEEQGQTLRIVGDASEFGEQFVSAPIAVEPGTDYVLSVENAFGQGKAAVKVTSTERRITLSSEILNSEGAERSAKRERKKKGDTLSGSVDPLVQSSVNKVDMIFASGDRREVRLVISNNGAGSVRPITEVGEVSLYNLGATPFQWTRYPRALIRGLQKNLFKTNTMLPLAITGMLLLALGGRGRALVILLVVPAYYLCAQSVLSTEYRYILAIHYFFFIMAAATIYCAGQFVGQVVQSARRRGFFGHHD